MPQSSKKVDDVESEVSVMKNDKISYLNEIENLKPLSITQDDEIMKEMMAADVGDDESSHSGMLIGLTPTASPLMMLTASNSDVASPSNSQTSNNTKMNNAINASKSDNEGQTIKCFKSNDKLQAEERDDVAPSNVDRSNEVIQRDREHLLDESKNDQNTDKEKADDHNYAPNERNLKNGNKEGNKSDERVNSIKIKNKSEREAQSNESPNMSSQHSSHKNHRHRSDRFSLDGNISGNEIRAVNMHSHDNCQESTYYKEERGHHLHHPQRCRPGNMSRRRSNSLPQYHQYGSHLENSRESSVPQESSESYYRNGLQNYHQDSSYGPYHHNHNFHSAQGSNSYQHQSHETHMDDEYNRNGHDYGTNRKFSNGHGPQIIKSLSSSSNSAHSNFLDRNVKSTIDGVNEDKHKHSTDNHSIGISPGPSYTPIIGNLPNSHSMRRAGSNSSSTCSTSTINNSVSLDSSLEQSSPKSRHLLPPTSSPRTRRFVSRRQDDRHQRSHSNSSCSTLSLGELSMNSYDGSRRRRRTIEAIASEKQNYDNHNGSSHAELLHDGSPKRRRNRQSESDVYLGTGRHKRTSSQRDVDSLNDRLDTINYTSSVSTCDRFENMDMNDSSSFPRKPSHHRRISSASTTNSSSSSRNRNMFGNLSTSPIISVDPDATPINKNTRDRRQNRDSPTQNEIGDIFIYTGKKDRGSERELRSPQKSGNRMRDEHNVSDATKPDKHFRHRTSYEEKASLSETSSRSYIRHGQARNQMNHGRHQQSTSLEPTILSVSSCGDQSRSPTPPLADNQSTQRTGSKEKGDITKHLRVQCFTPLPLRMKNSNSPAFSTIAPQMSWGITNVETPTFGDIGEWEENNSRGPSPNLRSTTPMSFWDEPTPLHKKRGASKDDFNNISRALNCSPSNSPANARETVKNNPKSPSNDHIFFRDRVFKNKQDSRRRCLPEDYRESKNSYRNVYHIDSYDENSQCGESNHIHQMFLTNGGRDQHNRPNEKSSDRIQSHPHIMSRPPHGEHPGVMNTRSDSWDSGQYPSRYPDHRDDLGMRSRMPYSHPPSRGNGGPFYPSNAPFHQHGNDNCHPQTRGRMGSSGINNIPPPGFRMRGHHGPPLHHLMGSHQHAMPLHHHRNLPPSQYGQTHDLPKAHHQHRMMSMESGPRWGGGPHHPHPGMRVMDMPGASHHSKRKCVPFKPPIPSKFQGNMEQMKDAPVPEFTSLVNFPLHMTAKQSSFPDGMRCCVMCGRACPCSASNKNKKGDKQHTGNGKIANNTISKHHRHQDSQGGSGNAGFSIIPTQNKGLCTDCDVNVWIVTSNGLEIKWCKGCKNFRPWAAFGEKGLATKCVRCRERQREKYAMQKEEKEKAKIKKREESKEKDRDSKPCVVKS